jgi:hypothetical protein
MAQLREAGFSIHTDPEGMVLRRELEGEVAEVRSTAGVPLNRSDVLRVRVGGDEWKAGSVAELLDRLEVGKAPRP